MYYKIQAHVKKVVRGAHPRISFFFFEKKKKKNAGDIIWHMCTKNPNQVEFLRYKVRQMFFLSFWAIFGLFLPAPLNIPENQNFEKNENRLWRCHHFKLALQKNTIKWCMLTQIWSVTDIIFCQFRPFFGLLPHYWPGKSKFGKYLKTTWSYYPFTCAP